MGTVASLWDSMPGLLPDMSPFKKLPGSGRAVNPFCSAGGSSVILLGLPSQNRRGFWPHAVFYLADYWVTIISWKLKFKYPGKGRSVLIEILLGDQHKALCLEDSHLGSTFIWDGFHLRSCQFINHTSALGYTCSHVGGVNFSPFSAKGLLGG